MPKQVDKREAVKDLKMLFEEYPTVGLANLYKVKANQLHEMRRKLRDIALLKVSKNILVEIALKELMENGEFKGSDALFKYLEGQNILVFTKEDPFKLAKMLDEAKIPSFARPGDIAPEDIVVQEGNTGLPPGPLVSEFNEVGLPARIVSGSVWIGKTTVVARKGDVISDKLASVLAKLGIKPVKIGLNLKVVYSDGLIYPIEALKLDVESYKNELLKAWGNAFKMALALKYFTPETLPTILAECYNTSLILALSIEYLTPETLPLLIHKALLETSAIGSLTSKAEKSEKRKVEKEELTKDEKKEEEEIGLASLFG
ncbi:50S ribosomal protein L10 [Candidatus Bathyarchaeota archaeon]|nr:50S ribosomal protein L10 [Candidatus Bathyarchaeota archaeon]MBS7612895.1 50S ribosomal protein L10 [Candidatus Bathyarchaeota archaeon]MBS7618276.1 50S ribosomal protein L10 [Candidatus Bathyarchaeota archaeon]